MTMVKWILVPVVLCLMMNAWQVQAAEKDLRSYVWAYNGKSYKGIQTTEYNAYDQALRNYLVQRIGRRFGIRLDFERYSGFDLLEMESLFKCRKSNEPYDLFLRSFPKTP
jgi:hypothetical protein